MSTFGSVVWTDWVPSNRDAGLQRRLPRPGPPFQSGQQERRVGRREVMKPRHIFAFLALALSTPAQTQTARDYFNELRAANAFNHYKDEYVCFRDDDTPTFAVIAKVSDVIRDMERASDAAGVKTMTPVKKMRSIPRHTCNSETSSGKAPSDLSVVQRSGKSGRLVSKPESQSIRFETTIQSDRHLRSGLRNACPGPCPV
jgi:hypothetical protein